MKHIRRRRPREGDRTRRAFARSVPAHEDGGAFACAPSPIGLAREVTLRAIDVCARDSIDRPAINLVAGRAARTALRRCGATRRRYVTRARGRRARTCRVSEYWR